jgi:hypothetical protein
MQPCLVPRSGPPGTRSRIVGTVAYRVVWNDPIARFLVPGGDRYRRRSRTVGLGRIDQPRARVRFHVPNVAPGRYAVVIYDGDEGGEHYTWSFFRVTPSG